MKNIVRKILSFGVALVLLLTFGVFALGSGEDEASSQGNGEAGAADVGKLSNYSVEIKSCRLAKDYEGKAIVIVKYAFTNNSDTPAAFWTSIDDTVYQGAVGLNECYIAAESANYSTDNQSKEVKKGGTLDVEVAYYLNDTTTSIDVEVSEMFSFSNKKTTKSFKIS